MLQLETPALQEGLGTRSRRDHPPFYHSLGMQLETSIGNWKKGQKMRGSRDFQKHEKRNICSAGAGSIWFSSFDCCLLRREGHILSSYVHMCISLVPFLALMLFLINSALVFSQAERKSQDNEMLSQALFACSVELSLWWMSDLVIDAICQLFVYREFNRFDNKFLYSSYYFSAWGDNSTLHCLQPDSCLISNNVREHLDTGMFGPMCWRNRAGSLPG